MKKTKDAICGDGMCSYVPCSRFPKCNHWKESLKPMKQMVENKDLNIAYNRGKEEAKKEFLEMILSSKERHLKDLKECATKHPIKHWIWVDATIERLEKQIKEIKSKLKEPFLKKETFTKETKSVGGKTRGIESD